MTLLSIFACDNIAVPLSSGFPASELRYILENSEAVTLVSSTKFQAKAEETLKEGLEQLPRKPVLNIVEKRRQGNGHDEVQLVPLPMEKGGMMLYTSGTTSRPVNTILFTPQSLADRPIEGCTSATENAHSSSSITTPSLELYYT